ncbi:nucleotide exchange factor GrpE [Alkalilimnicola sp. S0819]|uniref:nucleotide exchange factor GrpE n=1 Tax=Alkalilimnicola sp. S0819 TaxID=2613922 RepID=UPI001261788C|nr:nucleotide exchange factor GrpE [Alkalilimnicola sp. S0819]KAB7627906.1 nucleotide exchange factor GrpE [Alkalilimnicola sp. S0819]MPQ15542.1 nucleotide exchange factor GrpE [Alkalilimnicola sp. S0819]
MAEEKRPEAEPVPETAAEEPSASPQDAPGGAEDRVAQLESELEQLRRKADENWEKFVRASAEADNIRRRAERDLQQAHKFGLEKFAADLLAVKDSLEMGLKAAEGSTDVARLREGSELTLKMLGQAFDRHGIAEVNPLGEKFDPERHEAMAMQPSAEQPPNTVLEVIQKGYLLKERLLRPAMVLVAKAPEEGPSTRIDEQA